MNASMPADTVLLNPPATTELYTLSLHDALPISATEKPCVEPRRRHAVGGPEPEDEALGEALARRELLEGVERRSEEHTSELQSLTNLVCRLLLDKKKRSPSLRSCGR